MNNETSQMKRANMILNPLGDCLRTQGEMSKAKASESLAGDSKNADHKQPLTIANRHVFVRPTKEGEKLKLTYEQEHLCKLVYKKDSNERYVFDSTWDPSGDKVYSEDYIIVPLRSVYGGTFSYGPGEVFSNIIGSNVDPRHGWTWVGLLIAYGISCNSCITDGYFYAPSDPTASTYFINYHCNGTIVGGHTIGGIHATSVASGSQVLLVPICTAHNVSCTDNTGRTGAGFFMVTRSSGTGMVLNNYLQITSTNELESGEKQNI